MSSAGDALGTRASFELAVFFVTWVAIVLLALIVVHLHLRLQLLERRNAPANRPDPYAHLAGRRLADLLGGAGDSWQPQFVLFVSAPCTSCASVLDELLEPGWPAAITLLWTTPPPSTPPRLPSNVRALDDGPRISAALGIHATPFVLIVGDGGVVEQGMPINSLESLRRAGGDPASAPAAHGLGNAFKEVTP